MNRTTFIEDLMGYDTRMSGAGYLLTLKWWFSLAFRERSD